MIVNKNIKATNSDGIHDLLFIAGTLKHAQSIVNNPDIEKSLSMLDEMIGETALGKILTNKYRVGYDHWVESELKEINASDVAKAAFFFAKSYHTINKKLDKYFILNVCDSNGNWFEIEMETEHDPRFVPSSQKLQEVAPY